MEKDKIFFGENGLTSTSANHVANLAKELIQNIEYSLSNYSFYTTTVALIGTNNSNVLQQGVDTYYLEHIPSMLKEIAQAKSLIAWLREAIKAKERLIDEIEVFDISGYCKLKGLDVPKEPVREHILTEDEYYSALSIKARNKYYELETTAAVLGKAIHPTGSIAEERKKFFTILQKPNKVEGNGRDTIIYSYQPTVNAQKVENIFFELQNKHREVQAQLNSIKYECEQAIIASTNKSHSKYAEALANWRNQMQVLEAELVKYKKEKVSELSKLKIIIPDSLKNIYTKVSQLGK